MSSQSHGPEFEALVCSLPAFTARVGTDECGKPHLFDADYSHRQETLPVSIKTYARTGKDGMGGSICLADYFRQSRIVPDFLLVVGSYRPIPGKKVDWSVHIWRVGAEAWRRGLSYTRRGTILGEIQQMTNDRADNTKWQRFRLDHAKSFTAEHPGSGLQLRPKRDNKKQIRLQCALSAKYINELRRCGDIFEQDCPDIITNLQEITERTMSAAVDKYYTSARAVGFVLEILATHHPLDSYAVIVEPSAGAGAFLTPLTAAAPGAEIIAYDLEPESGDGATPIATLNFLTDTATVSAAVRNRKAIAIGNPPFGRCNSLAHRFITACAKIEGLDAVAFILGRGFNTTKVMAHVKGFYLAHHVNIPGGLCDFDDRARARTKNVPSCFQVWRRGVNTCSHASAPICEGWYYVDKDVAKTDPGAFDMQIVRAGGKAGLPYAGGDRRYAAADNYVSLKAHIRTIVDPSRVIEVMTARRPELAVHYDAATGPRSIARENLTPQINEVVAELANDPDEVLAWTLRRMRASSPAKAPEPDHPPK